MLNTFGDLLTFTKNRVNFVDVDDQVDLILKEAINFAYQTINKEVKKYKTVTITVSGGIASLPDDTLEVIGLDPCLMPGDAIKGNTIITSYEGDLKIVYAALNAPLTNLTDVLSIPEKYKFPISFYAAAQYYAFKKKTDLSNYYMNMYFNSVKDLMIVETESPYGEIYNCYEGWI